MRRVPNSTRPARSHTAFYFIEDLCRLWINILGIALGDAESPGHEIRRISTVDILNLYSSTTIVIGEVARQWNSRPQLATDPVQYLCLVIYRKVGQRGSPSGGGILTISWLHSAWMSSRRVRWSS